MESGRPSRLRLFAPSFTFVTLKGWRNTPRAQGRYLNRLVLPLQAPCSTHTDLECSESSLSLASLSRLAYHDPTRDTRILAASTSQQCLRRAARSNPRLLHWLCCLGAPIVFPSCKPHITRVTKHIYMCGTLDDYSVLRLRLWFCYKTLTTFQHFLDISTLALIASLQLCASESYQNRDSEHILMFHPSGQIKVSYPSVDTLTLPSLLTSILSPLFLGIR